MRSGDTIFPIASMSKVITVAGIMQLYEQGLFKMWDPVSEYLPGFKNPKVAQEKPDGSYEIVDAKSEVTLRQPRAGSASKRKRNTKLPASPFPATSNSATLSAGFLLPSSRESAGCTVSPLMCSAPSSRS